MSRPLAPRDWKLLALFLCAFAILFGWELWK